MIEVVDACEHVPTLQTLLKLGWHRTSLAVYNDSLNTVFEVSLDMLDMSHLPDIVDPHAHDSIEVPVPAHEESIEVGAVL